MLGATFAKGCPFIFVGATVKEALGVCHQSLFLFATQFFDAGFEAEGLAFVITAPPTGQPDRATASGVSGAFAAVVGEKTLGQVLGPSTIEGVVTTDQKID